MPRETYIETLIIGAGLTGLTTAFHLKRANRPFLVIEKEAITGGAIRTHRKSGFIYEEGPNTGVVSNPEVSELFTLLSTPDAATQPRQTPPQTASRKEAASSRKEAVLCRFEAAAEAAKSRWIYKNGAFHPLPAGLLQAVSTPLFSPRDKAGILLEPFRKKGTNPDESVADLVKRRLGQSFLDYAVDPFISGIYAGNPEALITRVALPKLYRLEQEYGSFIAGGFAKATKRKSPREKLATRQVFSAHGGLQNLIGALTAEVGPEAILCNTHIEEITPLKSDGLPFGEQGGANRVPPRKISDHISGYEVVFSQNGQTHRLRCRNLVSTVAAHQLRGVVPFIGEESLSRLESLEYAPVVQVATGYPTLPAQRFKAFGGLVPRIENRDILGVLFPSSCFAQRAPEGGSLFSFFLGGVRKPHLTRLSDREIVALVEKECRELLGIEPHHKPSLMELFRYPAAIPQYGAGHDQRCLTIEQLQARYPGLILAGNQRNGIGMADRILQATHIATTIVQTL